MTETETAEPRSGAEGATGSRRKLTEEQEREVTRLYAETETPVSEISQRFGIGESSVYRVAQRHGASLRGRTSTGAATSSAPVPGATGTGRRGRRPGSRTAAAGNGTAVASSGTGPDGVGDARAVARVPRAPQLHQRSLPLALPHPRQARGAVAAAEFVHPPPERDAVDAPARPPARQPRPPLERATGALASQRRACSMPRRLPTPSTRRRRPEPPRSSASPGTTNPSSSVEDGQSA